MTVWSRLWLAWAVLGLGSAAVLIAAQEAGVGLPAGVWWWWALPGVAGAAVLEVAALVNPARGDTLSEHIWKLGRGWRSLIAVYCLWAGWWLAFGDAWPSVVIAGLCWCAWHFTMEVPRG